jgi:rare lipoprotein A
MRNAIEFAAMYRRIWLMLAAGALLAGCAMGAPPPSHGHGAWRSPAGGYQSVGLASWYGKPFHGRQTASGQRYNMHAFTAAHRKLPFGTVVAVTNLANGRTIRLVINDRGPFIRGRIIDVSRRAAHELGFLRAGVTRVRVRALGRGRL